MGVGAAAAGAAAGAGVAAAGVSAALFDEPPPQALRVSAAHRVKNDSSEYIALFYSTMS